MINCALPSVLLRHGELSQMMVMWLFGVYLFLAIITGWSYSSPLPKPSESALSRVPEDHIHPLTTAALIHPSPASLSQPPSLSRETAAAPTSGVLCSQQEDAKTILSTPEPSSIPVPTIPINSLNPICVLEDYGYSCQSEHPVGCRCDVLCERFGDCCFDSNHTYNTNIPNFACVSNFVMNATEDKAAVLGELHYYWMIASCPNNELDTKRASTLSDLCKAQSLSTPPVTDNRTGLVYRNKYCAQCHGVPDKGLVTWPSQRLCNKTLQHTLGTFSRRNDKIDKTVLADCSALVFISPRMIAEAYRPFPLRECDESVIYECQPPPGTNTLSKEYRSLEELCQKEPGKVRAINTVVGLYKNMYCALCSSPTMNGTLHCPPEIVATPDTPPNLIVSLHVNDTPDILYVNSFVDFIQGPDPIIDQVPTTTKHSCAEGQVFDEHRKECRESISHLRLTYNRTSGLPIYPNCTLIALNATEYQTINNQMIFWIAVEQNVTIQAYDSEGSPLVCTNFTSNFTTTGITGQRYTYSAAYSILSYLCLSVDVIAATILLFTYTSFAEMRTFYGKLFMNFVLVLLLGDLTFLFGSAVYAVSLEDVVCQVVAILLHYLFLARFVWMSLLSLNVARHFYHAMKLIVSKEGESSSWHYLILYMAAGWLSPLLVLMVTVPVNYAVPGAVGYGVNGLCWMSQTLAVTVSFIVPLAICILFSTGAFLFVCIILMKLRMQSSKNSQDPKQKTGSRDCRVLIAVFCITGATWVFGFLALIDSSLSWMWYVFILLSATQAVLLTLAYICTAKVLKLYLTAVKRKCCYCGKKQPPK